MRLSERMLTEFDQDTARRRAAIVEFADRIDRLGHLVATTATDGLECHVLAPLSSGDLQICSLTDDQDVALLHCLLARGFTIKNSTRSDRHDHFHLQHPALDFAVVLLVSTAMSAEVI